MSLSSVDGNCIGIHTLNTRGMIVEMPVQEEISTKTPAWDSENLASNPHAVDDKASRVEAMFSSIARKYDLNKRLHSFWQDQIWRQHTVEAANLTGNDVVFDIACGTGDLAMAFSRAGVKPVVGIDFTQAMLDIAVAKATNADLQIEYRLGDAMALDVPDCSADIVSIAFGIRNVQDPNKALAEFYRILKPGGRLVVLEFSTPQNSLIRMFNNIYTKHIMPITATLIAQDTSGAYKYLPRSVEAFSDAQLLAQEIESVGFESIDQFPQTFGVCTITRGIKSFT
ncbi:MAG TPA: bifunctional demethylmenaquinone methyltransferase/2-methoxy-6-polyprenyl-1,4-benzoquinol methylase UbiE [Phycisphaerales bacterium]|nr:bifunctional demethylmenaquinone methyltransferase/2-methoxy-6-polyprenyl-1,4-benzoquinol methylase UbiE [Phycisphaerales bacterium]